MLADVPILVAEDEPFIALDVALAVEDAGGRVVGPTATVRHALALLEKQAVAGAILDVNLADGDITPVVAWFFERDVPFILQTEADLPPELASRFPDLVVRIKPVPTAQLVAEPDALLSARRHGSQIPAQI